MKNKKIIITIVLLLFLSVGVTLAFFTSTSTLDNEFKSGKYKTVSTDSFTSPSNWSPGDTTPKTITTKNEGTLPVRVRVKLEESWESENGDELPLIIDITQGMNDYPIYEGVAEINYSNEEDWVFYDDDYYYFIRELLPGESTSSLIESVTYNPNTPSDMSCTSNNGVYNCKSTGDGYDGATYTLNIIVETVQSDAALSAWGLSYDPTIPRYVYKSVSEQISNGDDITNYQVEEDYQSTNNNVFLRYTILGQTITASDIGFILNGNAYFVKGGGATLYDGGGYDPSLYYDENKTILLNAFGSANCTDNISSIECSVSNIEVQVDNMGNVFAEDTQNSWVCGFYDGRNSNCFMS